MKIFLLLFVMISAIGILRSYVSQEKIRRQMANKGVAGNFIAACFGAVTPFCSCSSIPMFFGFVRAGVPMGITFSFIVTSPLINEYLVVLMLGGFGWKITVSYVISGIVMGVLAGLAIGRMKLERYIVDDMRPDASAEGRVSVRSFFDRIKYGIGEALDIIKRLWLWVMAGLAVGAVIHNYVPDEAIQAVVRGTGVFSVPIATVIGVPMYGSCAAIVPIAVVLFQKGLPLGTVLALMMAISALSLPEAVMLRRAMKLRLILIYFAITTLGIIFTGYLFNYLQRVLA